MFYVAFDLAVVLKLPMDTFGTIYVTFNLMEEIENIKWHIIGLSEVRRNGELLMNIKEGYLLYHKGRDDIKQSGVGFLINKEITKNMKEFPGESDRVASLTIKLNRKYNLKIIQVYAPTSSSTPRNP